MSVAKIEGLFIESANGDFSFLKRPFFPFTTVGFFMYLPHYLTGVGEFKSSWKIRSLNPYGTLCLYVYSYAYF